MKRLQITLIGLVGAVMILLCVALGLFLTGELPSRTGNGNYSLVQEKKFPARDIQSLKIDYGRSSSDVLFCEGTGDEIIVREYMNYEPKENQLSVIEQSDGELIIKGARRSQITFFSIGFRGAYTEICLPAGFAKGMEALTVKTVSGDISSEIGLAIRNGFTVSTTSGDVLFPQVQAGKIQASSTSGDITFEEAGGMELSASGNDVSQGETVGDMELSAAGDHISQGEMAGSMTLSTTSGGIRLESAAAETMDISTTSGDIAVEQARGRAEISTTSGEIRVSGLEGPLSVSTTSGDVMLGQVTGDVTLSTTSGGIRLQEGQGDLDAESTSGDIRVGNLAGSFQMDTTSGEVSVSRAASFGTAHSVSGDIRIFLADLEGDLDISTTSGTVDLALPETADFRFRFGTTSGECRTFFDEALSFDSKRRNARGEHGEGTHSVEISTVSGDLSVRKFQDGDL